MEPEVGRDGVAVAGYRRSPAGGFKGVAMTYGVEQRKEENQQEAVELDAGRGAGRGRG